MDAGVASLAAGDSDAAVGFYRRADGLSPDNAKVKAGLAGAYVLGGDPVSAIPLFDEAEKLGPIEAARVADRGLAFDMIGDPVTAQRFYQQALATGPSDETSRRLGLSQAISQDRRAMEATLGPLLQRQDKAAWRTRALSLAILGQVEEADSIAHSTMPASMASAIGNYLRYMPKLTAAQQATAANLGRFPRAAEIGHDDPRFAQLVRARPALAAAASVPVPANTAAGKLSARDEKKRAKALAKAAAASPPARQIPAVAVAQPAAVLSKPVPSTPLQTAPPPAVKPAAMPQPMPAQVATVSAVTPPVLNPSASAAATPRTVQELAPVTSAAVTAPNVAVPAAGSQPGFTTLDSASSGFALKPGAAATPQPATPTPAVTAPAPIVANPPAPPRPVPPAPPKPRSLSEVFADLTPPSREAEPEAGAVDLRKLKAAPTPPPARPATEAKPARDAAKGKDKSKAAQAEADKACEVAETKGGRAARGKVATKAVPAQCKDGEVAKDAKTAKAKEPSHPSRIWVQVATGRDKRALAFDWRRLVREDAAAFKGRKPFVSAWGQTNRLLTGPFETAGQAGTFLSQLRKAGVDGAFQWNSPAGQVVDALPGG
ncbi:MAG: SPOR domain-containing protein [Proteobacteria bacterium]|nr:SPOR domain-containing protein [Pseudomonadota bacterium]